jgi:glycerophosphoryl diester phosphodiesterase
MRLRSLSSPRAAALAVVTACVPTLLSASSAAAAVAPSLSPATEDQVDVPLVIAHRGASGYRPEHTLAAYRLAVRMNADYIEPDLVSTKDGVLVARHENEISGTTDVDERPEFADRATTKTIDGAPVTGWFTEDFTYAELQTLRAEERLPELRPGSARRDGRYKIPTFQSVLRLADRLSAREGRTIGVIPEIKHSTYFSDIGLPMERTLVRVLDRFDLETESAPVIVQSFEVSNLRRLDTLTDVRLVQLLNSAGAPYDLAARGDDRTYADLATPAGLEFIATYADLIGPNKDMVIPRDAKGFLTKRTPLVRNAHARSLQVIPFTFRAENAFLPSEYDSSADPAQHGDLFEEQVRFLRAGIDGFFTDFPDIGYAARNSYVRERNS